MPRNNVGGVTMDYLKTGRLIAKKRKAQDYTLEELSKSLSMLWKEYESSTGAARTHAVYNDCKYLCPCLRQNEA